MASNHLKRPVQAILASPRGRWLALPLILSVLAVPLAYPPASQGQCVQGAVTCTNHATLPQRSCSASVVCGGFPGTTTGFAMVSMSNNVIDCSPTSVSFMTGSTPTFVIMATAMTTAPPTRSCGWNWYSASGSTSGNFSITEADGLPVELMSFSIEDSESEHNR